MKDFTGEESGGGSTILYCLQEETPQDEPMQDSRELYIDALLAQKQQEDADRALQALQMIKEITESCESPRDWDRAAVQIQEILDEFDTSDLK